MKKCNSCKTLKNKTDFYNGPILRKTCERCRRGNKLRPFRDIIRLQIYKRCWCCKF